MTKNTVASRLWRWQHIQASTIHTPSHFLLAQYPKKQSRSLLSHPPSQQSRFAHMYTHVNTHTHTELCMPTLTTKAGAIPVQYGTCIRTNLSVLEKRTTVFCMVSSSSSSSSLLGELSISATLTRKKLQKVKKRSLPQLSCPLSNIQERAVNSWLR